MREGSRKVAIWVGMIAGSLIGGWIPSLFGAGWFSIAGLIGSLVGALGGIFLGYQVAKRYL